MLYDFEDFLLQSACNRSDMPSELLIESMRIWKNIKN